VPEKIFVAPLHFFGEHFRDGHLVSRPYSSVSFILAVFLLTLPPVGLPMQPFVKVGARAPVPYGVGATGYMPFRV